MKKELWLQETSLWQLFQLYHGQGPQPVFGHHGSGVVPALLVQAGGEVFSHQGGHGQAAAHPGFSRTPTSSGSELRSSPASSISRKLD